MQDVVVYIILALAVAFALYRLVRRIRSFSSTDKCDGCDGCGDSKPRNGGDDCGCGCSR
ncbi:MAG: FeoB-associated Cys-rich membrane protein [Rikenellaceae bacterium]